jgi:hypothetical protein
MRRVRDASRPTVIIVTDKKVGVLVIGPSACQIKKAPTEPLVTIHSCPDHDKVEIWWEAALD